MGGAVSSVGGGVVSAGGVVGVVGVGLGDVVVGAVVVGELVAGGVVLPGAVVEGFVVVVVEGSGAIVCNGLLVAPPVLVGQGDDELGIKEGLAPPEGFPV